MLLISNLHVITWLHRLNNHQSLENIASQCFLLTSDNIDFDKRCINNVVKLILFVNKHMFYVKMYCTIYLIYK